MPILCHLCFDRIKALLFARKIIKIFWRKLKEFIFFKVLDPKIIFHSGNELLFPIRKKKLRNNMSSGLIESRSSFARRIVKISRSSR